MNKIEDGFYFYNGHGCIVYIENKNSNILGWFGNLNYAGINVNSSWNLWDNDTYVPLDNDRVVTDDVRVVMKEILRYREERNERDARRR